VVCAEDKSISLPDGCAIVTVSDKVAAHLMLKGIIDAAKEVEKLEKKSTQLKNQYDKLIKAQQVQGYDTKVPEDIRLANTEKCQQTQKEVERLVDAIAALKTL
jgi:valyl-tRNA synthetase